MTSREPRDEMSGAPAAAAALVTALSAQDEFLSFPPWASEEWSEAEVQAFFDLFGEIDGVPQRDHARYRQHLAGGAAAAEAEAAAGVAAGAGAGTAAGSGSTSSDPQDQDPWPWQGPAKYRVGAQHPLVYGNTRPQTNPSATVRLFCFLWTGGCASFFGQLQSLFAESPIELVPINLPGRDKDAETQPALSWAEAITKLADALCDGWVQSMPFAFFGHSLGAWTAIETIHELRDRGLPLPLHLFVSAKFAPQLSADERAHALSQFRARGGLGASSDLGSAEAPKVASAETEVFWAFNNMYGLEQRLSNSAFFRSSFEKIFRADLCLSEGYTGGEGQRAVPRLMTAVEGGGSGAVLSCGITAMAADGDVMVPQRALEGWRDHTTGEFRLQRFPGGHSFFLEASGEGQKGWTACIRSTLELLMTTTATKRTHPKPKPTEPAQPKSEPEPEEEPEPELEPEDVGVLDTRSWCVVGNHGRNPIAAQLVQKLRACGRSVVEVNPYTGPIKSLLGLPREAQRTLETVNLCVNPTFGQKLLAEIAGQQQQQDFSKLRHVFIQPGAGDAGLIGYSKEVGLCVHEGCVLVEM